MLYKKQEDIQFQKKKKKDFPVCPYKSWSNKKEDQQNVFGLFVMLPLNKDTGIEKKWLKRVLRGGLSAQG